jgi:hypothetical protein
MANGGGFGELVVAAIGAGPDNSSLTLDHGTLISNAAQGGAGGSGGAGGNGLGGGAYNDAASSLTLKDALVTLNQADGGAEGQGVGGGAYSLGALDLVMTEIALNQASTSNNDTFP